MYPSRTVDKYSITKTLGSGSYGTVYLGTYGINKYAIKEASLAYPMHTMWEASLLSLMSHPNIIKPFEYKASSDYSNMIIVMPEADRTLRDAMKMKLKHDEVKLYAWQLLSAVDYIHSNHIVHRDLKPSNILLDDAQLYIIDFGLSRFLHRNRGPISTVAQTYTHRAPEVFRAIADKDTSSLGTEMDMWSVGMMILEMFYQGEYFVKYSEKEVSSILLSNRSSMLHDDIDVIPVSDDVKGLLHSLLSIDPRGRPSAREAMSSPWFSGYRYQSPEYINYPDVPINLQGKTVAWISSMLRPYMDKCGYTDEVLYQALRMIKMMYINDPSVLQHASIRDRYYRIILAIAGSQLAEYNTETIRGCDLLDLDTAFSTRDIYDIFTLLGGNIIIP
jgi:serine/threonine protein kinase